MIEIPTVHESRDYRMSSSMYTCDKHTFPRPSHTRWKRQMPAVRAAAMMEYCGLALKASVVSDMRRDLDLKLRDLENVADHLAGDREVLNYYL